MAKSLRNFDGFACVVIDLNRVKCVGQGLCFDLSLFYQRWLSLHPNRGVRFFRLNSIEAGRNLVSFIGDDVLFCQVDPVSVVEAVRFGLIDPWRDVLSARFAAHLKGKGVVDPPFRLWPAVRGVGRLGFGRPSALLSWLSCFRCCWGRSVSGCA